MERKLQDMIHEVTCHGSEADSGSPWIRMSRNYIDDSSEFCEHQTDFYIRCCEFDPGDQDTYEFCENAACGLDLIVNDDHAEIRISGFNIFEILGQTHSIRDRCGTCLLDDSREIKQLICLYDELAGLLGVQPKRIENEEGEDTMESEIAESDSGKDMETQS